VSDQVLPIAETAPCGSSPAEIASSEIAPSPPTGSKRLRWFELSLVLSIAFGESLATSLFLHANGKPVANLGSYSSVMGLLHETAALLLLGYILYRRRLRLRDIGLRWSFRDLWSGLVVTVVSFVAYAVGHFLVHLVHHAIFGSATNGLTAHQVFGYVSYSAVPVFLLNPFFEELIVRAYLMSEIKDLTGSWLLSIVVSVAVQSSYHIYYGWQGALSLAFQFLVFSIYYARSRRATPVIIAHEVFDIAGLIQLW